MAFQKWVKKKVFAANYIGSFWKGKSIGFNMRKASPRAGNRTRHTACSVTCPSRGHPSLGMGGGMAVLAALQFSSPGDWVNTPVMVGSTPLSWPGSTQSWPGCTPARTGVALQKDLKPETWERTWGWYPLPFFGLTDKLKTLPSPSPPRTIPILICLQISNFKFLCLNPNYRSCAFARLQVRKK